MIRHLSIMSLAVPALIATACTNDNTADYENEREMSVAQLAALRTQYAEFLAKEGIAEFVGEVRITPVSGFLDFRAPGTAARDLVSTLQPVQRHLATNVGALARQLGPFSLRDGNPFWWPMDFLGLDRHPVEDWPQVAFFDVTAEIEGQPTTYRALVFRRASGYTHIVDPVLNVQPLVRISTETTRRQAELTPNRVEDAADRCPDINATNGWIHNRVQVDCVIDWAYDHTLRWEVDWDLAGTADCFEAGSGPTAHCSAQNPLATTTLKAKRFYYDGALVNNSFGNGYTCDYWGWTKIYYKAEFDKDDAEDTYHNNNTVPPSHYGAHMAWAGGLRVFGQNGPWGTSEEQEKIAWLPLLQGTAAGTTILYHSINFLHWMLGTPAAPPKLIDSEALMTEGNYSCACMQAVAQGGSLAACATIDEPDLPLPDPDPVPGPGPDPVPEPTPEWQF